LDQDIVPIDMDGDPNDMDIVHFFLNDIPIEMGLIPIDMEVNQIFLDVVQPHGDARRPDRNRLTFPPNDKKEN
jgi:hypothetical protein